MMENAISLASNDENGHMENGISWICGAGLVNMNAFLCWNFINSLLLFMFIYPILKVRKLRSAMLVHI